MGNKRSAGFTIQERQSFENKNFLFRGYVDTFRKQHRDVVGYTYWGYRHGGRKTNKDATEAALRMAGDQEYLLGALMRDVTPIWVSWFNKNQVGIIMAMNRGILGLQPQPHESTRWLPHQDF